MKEVKDIDKYIDEKTLAEMLGVHRVTIGTARREGRPVAPYVIIGPRRIRYQLSEVRRVLRERAIHEGTPDVNARASLREKTVEK